MPKKLKLDLGGLKVQSFVTSLENGDEKKIKGGATLVTCETCEPECPSGGTCLTACGTCNTCVTCNTCPASCGGTCDSCYFKCPTYEDPDCTFAC